MADSPREFLRNSVKDKLARDQVVASMIVRLVRSVEIAQIAKTAGFDSFYIDMEHNSFRSTPPVSSAWPDWPRASLHLSACLA